jgi:hypothetical protein
MMSWLNTVQHKCAAACLLAGLLLCLRAWLPVQFSSDVLGRVIAMFAEDAVVVQQHCGAPLQPQILVGRMRVCVTGA